METAPAAVIPLPIHKERGRVLDTSKRRRAGQGGGLCFRSTVIIPSSPLSPM